MRNNAVLASSRISAEVHRYKSNPGVPSGNCRDTEFVGLSVIKNQGLGNKFGHAPDDAEQNKLDSPDL